MDMSQYRDLFVSESRGHLSAFNELIVRLEENAADREAIDELFRHAHSLKGMAATMQFDAITGLAHRMEDLLSKVRSDEFPFSPVLADLLLEGSDMLAGMVSMIENGVVQQPHPAALLEALSSFTPDQTGGADRKVTQETNTLSETPPADATPAPSQFRKTDTFKSVRVKTDTLDRLVTITGELITTRYRLTDQARRHAGAGLEEPLRQLSSLLRELRDEVFQARMLPFVFAAERFPRLVRDLARKQGKEISFQIVGKEIELDRGILEEITEPLVHILRNAVDHGMETPDDRVAAGKPFGGSITITVTRDKDHVDIVIADDGRGMNPVRLKEMAIEKGVITPEQADRLSAQATLMLVCAPGFSTADQVSDISGRGVGMDAVKTAVHALGGTLAIESEIGRGSRFTLRLPITVSIIHALLVDCCNMTIAFPVSAVSRTIELKRSDIFEENGRTVCAYEDRTIPVKSLNRLLGRAMPQGSGTVVPAVVVEIGDTAVGLLTDRLLGQQEIFVKPLGAPLSGMKALSGGAITGDGRIVFVVDASVFV
ncbi:MAG TPA: chemotaxis protein CheA [Desulfuromonadales bacterium]|nr:chemotaxis protein CheA [Desulfuromonadales bacterium]